MSDQQHDADTAKLEDVFPGTQSEAGPDSAAARPDTAAGPDAPAASTDTAATLPLGDRPQPAEEAPAAASTAPQPQPRHEPVTTAYQATAQRTGPRTRWAGIIWGLIFAATGWFSLSTLTAASRRAAFNAWLTALNAGGWVLVGAFGLGGLLLVIGLIRGLRAAGRARA